MISALQDVQGQVSYMEVDHSSTSFICRYLSIPSGLYLSVQSAVKCKLCM